MGRSEAFRRLRRAIRLALQGHDDRNPHRLLRRDPRRLPRSRERAASPVLFLDDLQKVYPGAKAFVTRGPGGGVLRVHLENWSRNPLFLGSYTCNQPGYFTTIAGNEAPPVGNFFFAGEHSSSAKAARQPGLIGGGAEGGPLQRDVASGHHARLDE